MTIQQDFEKYLLEFYSRHKISCFVDIRTFCHETGYSLEQVKPIRYNLIAKHMANAKRLGDKFFITLTGYGLSYLEKQQHSKQEPLSIFNFQGANITGQNVALGNGNINISVSSDFLKQVIQNIEETKNISDNEKTSAAQAFKGLSKWIDRPFVICALEKAVKIVLG